MGGGYSCTTMRIYLMPQNFNLKNAWKGKLFKTKILIQRWVDNTYRMKYMVTVAKK